MFISKKNYLSAVLIVLIALGLVDNSLSLFKRTTIPYYSDSCTTYTAKNHDIGIYARVDVQADSYNRHIISSISHSSKYLSGNCLEIGDFKICNDDLLNVKYELIHVGKYRSTVLLSLDLSFHSDKYLVSRETIDSEYIKAPISYSCEFDFEINTEDSFSLTIVSGDKRYAILDNFELHSIEVA